LVLMAACGAPRPVPHAPAPKLESASLEQLVTTFNRNAAAVRTMQLKLELTARAGKKKYVRISAFLLTQKPSSIRITGKFPLLGTIFDMASDGSVFELNIPTQGQFLEGRNDVIPAVTPNPLEKLRPQVVLNALLINPIPDQDHVALDPSADPAEYQVLVLSPGTDGIDRIVRRITFSRYDLLPHAQVLYDGDGVHSTVATYSNFSLVDGLPLPMEMTIDRPVDGYALRLQVVKNGTLLNHPFVQADPFQLQPPAGSKVVKLSANLGAQPAADSTAAR
jgi:hypothetical protein